MHKTIQASISETPWTSLEQLQANANSLLKMGETWCLSGVNTLTSGIVLQINSYSSVIIQFITCNSSYSSSSQKVLLLFQVLQCKCISVLTSTSKCPTFYSVIHLACLFRFRITSSSYHWADQPSSSHLGKRCIEMWEKMHRDAGVQKCLRFTHIHSAHPTVLLLSTYYFVQRLYFSLSSVQVLKFLFIFVQVHVNGISILLFQHLVSVNENITCTD